LSGSFSRRLNRRLNWNGVEATALQRIIGQNRSELGRPADSDRSRRYHGAMNKAMIPTASRVAQVRYEIRGRLARRAHELERDGHDILHLNVGNPGAACPIPGSGRS